MHFEIVTEIVNIETIAIGQNIRELHILQKRFGKGRWRKLKGAATVSLFNNEVRLAEIHCMKQMESVKNGLKSKDF